MKSVEYYCESANRDCPNAQFHLAKLLLSSGQTRRAIDLLRSSAAHNNTAAQVLMAGCYYLGVGCEKSPEKALALYRLAAAKGNKLAIYNLGNFYRRGECVPQDLDKAVEQYRLAAKRGLKAACFNLGVYYFNQKDAQEKAFRWFNRVLAQYSAVQPDGIDPLVHYNLGLCYWMGLGTPPLPETAFKLWETAASMQHPESALNLAYCYYKGNPIPKNEEFAVHLLQIIVGICPKAKKILAGIQDQQTAASSSPPPHDTATPSGIAHRASTPIPPPPSVPPPSDFPTTNPTAIPDVNWSDFSGTTTSFTVENSDDFGEFQAV